MQQETSPARAWWCEFTCNGSPFVWRGDALDQYQAIARARSELSHDHPDFSADDARLVACLER